MDIAQLRQEYARARLDRQDLHEDPFQQFELWFQQAVSAEVLEVNAVTLATADDRGQPSARTVLLKYFDRDGFVFFTNYNSRKAEQMRANRHVALLFFWAELQRQVKIEGTAEKTSAATSLKYFATRPRGSQLGAWCSPQSSVISSRQFLEAKLAEMRQKFRDGEVPLPSFWGGYRVIPDRVEFWQGGTDRLHDRFLYQRQGDGTWAIERLAP
jgi:pyridoxamine 5'-phosphate oxidase